MTNPFALISGKNDGSWSLLKVPWLLLYDKWSLIMAKLRLHWTINHQFTNFQINHKSTKSTKIRFHQPSPLYHLSLINLPFTNHHSPLINHEFKHHHDPSMIHPWSIHLHGHGPCRHPSRCDLDWSSSSSERLYPGPDASRHQGNGSCHAGSVGIGSPCWSMIT